MTPSERIAIFEDTMNRCRTHPALVSAIEKSLAAERFYDAESLLPVPPARFDTPCTVSLTGYKSFQAAFEHEEGRVCVLNFASAGTPGGGVKWGSTAQEEDLCRVSTLYPNLVADKVRAPYHDRHMQMFADGTMDYLYNDECIYTPGVVVIKHDADPTQVLPEDQWRTVDVITCAAPNLNRCNGPLPTADTLQQLFEQRFRRIMTIAALEGAEVLILGAFGCGVFSNPPEMVARAARNALSDFCRCFRHVEFAVWNKNGKNYPAFAQVLADLCQPGA